MLPPGRPHDDIYRYEPVLLGITRNRRLWVTARYRAWATGAVLILPVLIVTKALPFIGSLGLARIVLSVALTAGLVYLIMPFVNAQRPAHHWIIAFWADLGTPSVKRFRQTYSLKGNQ